MCASGLKIRTLKNAHCLSFPPKPCALMLRHAPSSAFAVLRFMVSLDICCRGGSIPTLWQTSLMRWAVMSLISSWRIVGNPPHGQLSACSTLNVLLHTH